MNPYLLSSGVLSAAGECRRLETPWPSFRLSGEREIVLSSIIPGCWLALTAPTPPAATPAPVGSLTIDQITVILVDSRRGTGNSILLSPLQSGHYFHLTRLSPSDGSAALTVRPSAETDWKTVTIGLSAASCSRLEHHGV